MSGDPMVGRIRLLDSCALSDAGDASGVPTVALGLGPVSVPSRIAGRVITVQLREPAGEARPGRHLGTAAVDASEAGDVIVVAAEGRTDAAGWGGILSLAAQRRGVSGVIVDGACRDIDQAVDIGLPVYARAAVARTARGRLVEHAWNTTVTVAGIQVDGGDYVLADRSGVVFVPRARAEELVSKAEELAAREQEMERRVTHGEPVSVVMSTSYETLLVNSREDT